MWLVTVMDILPLAVCLSWATFVASEKGDHGVNVPMETFQYGDYFFTFYSQRANWDEAFTICKATHARLAIVHTLGRAEFLARSLSETQMGFEDVWVGARFMKDHWVWVPNGRELPETKDNKNYPPWVQLPTQRGKNCMALDRIRHDEPIFVELHCRLPRSFICEKSVVEAIDNYPQLGLQVSLASSRYITYHARVTWDEALAFCRQSGAMLAVVPDQRTANFLVSLMRRSRPGQITFRHGVERRLMVDYPPALLELFFIPDYLGVILDIEFESVWIGGKYLFNEWVWLSSNRVFSNVTGSDGYPPWIYNSSRPNMGKDCLLLDHHTCRSSKKAHRSHNLCEEPIFIDTDCTKKNDFICETVPPMSKKKDVAGTYMGMTYFFSNTELNWFEAQKDCWERNMTLAALDTPQKLKFVITMMAELSDEWDHLWLGGTYNLETNMWCWTVDNRTIPFPYSPEELFGNSTVKSEVERSADGELVEHERFPPWCVNKLAYDEASTCLNLDRGDHSIPAFYGLDCNIPQGYVCQMDDDTDPFMDNQEVPPQYVLVKKSLSFHQAEQACKNNNTFLAVVNTMTEAKKVVPTISPADSLVWVGAKRENGHWWWKQTGEFIPDIAGVDGYPPWESLTTDQGAQCLAMTVGTQDWPLFVERPCTDQLIFLCEAPKKSYPHSDMTLSFGMHDYIFYFQNVSWFTALETCAVSGTSLAPVTNIHIAKFLVTAMSEHFYPLWVSGRYPGRAWEWITTGEPIPSSPSEGYPPWNTASPDSLGQEGKSCLLLDSNPQPMFRGSKCEDEHMFVCMKTRADASAELQKRWYEKDVKINGMLYQVISRVTTFQKAIEMCAQKGTSVVTVSSMSAAQQILEHSEGGFWLNARRRADGAWEWRNTRRQLEPGISFPDKISDPQSENKCLTINKSSETGEVMILTTRCRSHLRVVCEDFAAHGPQEQSVVLDNGDKLTVKRSRSWEEASMICSSMGGDLVRLTSPTEVLNSIKSLSAEFGDLWIGGYLETNGWMWETIRQRIDFSKLPPLKEHDKTTIKKCLSIDRESSPSQLLLRARACNTSLSFVCREESKSCPSLKTSDESMRWVPEKCALESMEKGSVCKASCTGDKELVGPERIVCMDGQWYGKKNYTIIPRCVSLAELEKEIKMSLDDTFRVYGDVGVLFLLDESRTYGKKEYNQAKTFIQNIISAFPLGKMRSAGVLTFSSTSRLIIEVSEHNTCYFFEEINSLEQRGNKTRNFLVGLKDAEHELRDKDYLKKAIVIFMTSGVDDGPSNYTLVAERLKDVGVTIFAVGVSQYNRNQLEEISSVVENRLLTFGFRTFEAMNNVAMAIRRGESDKNSVARSILYMAKSLKKFLREKTAIESFKKHTCFTTALDYFRRITPMDCN